MYVCVISNISEQWFVAKIVSEEKVLNETFSFNISYKNIMQPVRKLCKKHIYTLFEGCS